MKNVQKSTLTGVIAKSNSRSKLNNATCRVPFCTFVFANGHQAHHKQRLHDLISLFRQYRSSLAIQEER